MQPAKRPGWSYMLVCVVISIFPRAEVTLERHSSLLGLLAGQELLWRDACYSMQVR